MTSRTAKMLLTNTRLHTVKEVMGRTGLSAAGVSHRMSAREFMLGPYLRPAGGYLFTEDQFRGLCEDWGEGRDAVRKHAKERAKGEPSQLPRRRKAS